MDREVFQSNKVIMFLIIGAVYIGVTYVFMTSDFPIFFLIIFYAVGIIIIISSLKSKLIVEDGMLRYEKLIGGEEIELKHVAQIVTREVETIVNKNRDGSDPLVVEVGKFSVRGTDRDIDQERKVEKVIYIIDKSGQTVFSVPASLVGFTQRTRFKEAIHKVNASIEIY